jgi:DNA-binding beta-propeller fold protein YncE
MRKSVAIFLTLFMLFVCEARAQKKSPLKLIVTTPLPGSNVDFDHFGVDVKGNRLFLTAEEQHKLEVFDLRTGKWIRSITGFEAPHAMAYLPDSNKLIVTDGGDDFGKLELVSLDNYKVVDTMKLLANADAAVYNPVNKYYYVESHPDKLGVKSHLVHIIDTKTFKRIGDLTLPGGRSAGMAVDHSGKKLYVNLIDNPEVGVVDLETRQLIARWPVPDAHFQNSMTLDESNHRLYVASRDPAKFFVFDTDTGKVIAIFPCAGVNDDMSYDPALKRIYISGDGATSVFQQRDANHYEHIADVPTGYRAKTAIFVPELNRLYVAVSGKGKPKGQLALQVYQTQP